MILSNVSIQETMDSGRLVITPEPSPRKPMPGQDCPYQTSAVDLRLGNELSIYVDGSPIVIDLTKGKFAALAPTVTRLETLNAPFVLEPRQFVLGRTYEKVALPLLAGADHTLAARVEGKSSYARCGLLVHFTAPTVHAGFERTITLEIINLGPYAITLRPMMPICQLIIEEVRGVPFRNDSQFQGQTRPSGR